MILCHAYIPALLSTDYNKCQSGNVRQVKADYSSTTVSMYVSLVHTNGTDRSATAGSPHSTTYTKLLTKKPPIPNHVDFDQCYEIWIKLTEQITNDRILNINEIKDVKIFGCQY